MRNAIALLLVSVLSAACHRASPTASPAPAPQPTVDPQVARLPLGARLEREAHSRPTGTPSVEAVMAALSRGGLSLAGQQQVLASTVLASYCTIAVTGKGAVLSVCEYPAEEAARRGLDFSHRTFDRIIPGRQLSLNHKTMLTVTGASADEARAAAAIFAAL
jgi:hypothetical protein